MAGIAGRRSLRVLRAVALLGITASVLGTWSPAAAPSAVSADAALLRMSPETLRAATLDVRAVRPEVPPGFGTIEQRAAQAAAEEAAAAAARAAAEAAARSKGPAAGSSSPRATTTGTSSPAPVTPKATTAPVRLPLGVDPGSSTQVITVVAPSSGSTTATLTAWQLGAGGWTAVVGPVAARIGRDGVGVATEDSSRTPGGTFGLTEAFGRAGDPGTALPYRVIDNADWWVSDAKSSLYNQHTRCAPGTCPFDESAGEHLFDAGASYNYAVVIDYNRSPAVPGRGSAFFLHVTNGAPTVGCVAVPQSSLVAIMRWLDPAARPLISIGVG